MSTSDGLSGRMENLWLWLTAGPGKEGPIERGARYGYFAKGVIYSISGILAIRVALGHPVSEPGSEGALETVITQPFGTALLVLLVIGLAAYIGWRAIMAIADTEDKGHDLKGIVQRLSYVASGLAYAGVVLTALQLILSAGRDGGESSAWEDWTLRALQLPAGMWLVILVGVIVMGAGIGQFAYGITGNFEDELKSYEMNENLTRLAGVAGRLGYMFRGFIYGLIGLFLVDAARSFDPEQAGGMADTLQWLRDQPYGPYLLAIFGFGLLAYGVFALLQSRYREIDAD